MRLSSNKDERECLTETPHPRARSTVVRSGLNPRYRDSEAAGGIVARSHNSITTVQPRDLPHQREAQPRSIRVRAQPVEGQEDAFPLALRDALASVHDTQHRPSIVWSHLDPNRRAAMPTRILKQVANKPAQQV